MEITFLGATQTVTGSKYLVSHQGKKILIDCGLFQGLKELRLRNWEAFPISPKEIDAVILTHAHIDHSGYLPLLAKNGFKGKIYSTPGTFDLCKILLPDSGHLQEEEARYANKKGFSKHKPALPLYTQKDAENALSQFETIDFNQSTPLGNEFNFSFFPAGHILGAALVLLRWKEKSLLFTGDLGRPHDLIMNPPTQISSADYLVTESTYGNRLHPQTDLKEEMAKVIQRTVVRGGVIVVPAFAVGRAQALLYLVYELKREKKIQDIPVFLNSPMATDATHLYCTYHSEHRLNPEECKGMCQTAKFVHSVEESKALNQRKDPMIIISASGMATGGRVLHHLKAFAPDAKNTILLVGFQAAGTRGAALASGVKTIKIHGVPISVRAEVVNAEGLSAHADYAEILQWMKGFKTLPKKIWITHGEPTSAQALAQHIKAQFGKECEVPQYLEKVQL